MSLITVNPVAFYSTNEKNFSTSSAISADGKTLVIAALPGGTAVNAYIAKRTNGVWGSIQPIPNLNIDSYYLPQVTISKDGNIILVGILDSNSDTGACLPVINGSVSSDKFFPLDLTANALFGNSISISYDGKTAIIGASGLNSNTGAAYIFIRSDTIWTQQAKLSDIAGSIQGKFGNSVAISGDGNTAVIGSNVYSGVGKAFVFTRSDVIWTQKAQLTVPGTTSEDQFASAVTISGDANTILVSAPGTANKVYVFVNFADAWSLQKVIDSPGPSSFGFYDVALSCNGNIALISTGTTGQGFLYTRSGVAWSSPSMPFYNFRESVSLSADGMIALGGDHTYNNQQGIASLYYCGFDIPNIPCFFDLQGPPGARGSDGIGVQGLQGIQGLTGAQGPIGFQGPAGANLTAHAYLKQIILFSLMLYGGFLFIFSVITFF